MWQCYGSGSVLHFFLGHCLFCSLWCLSFLHPFPAAKLSWASTFKVFNGKLFFSFFFFSFFCFIRHFIFWNWFRKNWLGNKFWLPWPLPFCHGFQSNGPWLISTCVQSWRSGKYLQLLKRPQFFFSLFHFKFALLFLSMARTQV